MDNEIPKCPSCESSAHVVLVNTTQKIGTALGGVAGGFAGYASTATVVTVSSFVPVVGTSLGLIVSGLTGMLTGIFSGSAVGNQLGEHVDRHVIGQYRCNCCGTEFGI